MARGLQAHRTAYRASGSVIQHVTDAAMGMRLDGSAPSSNAAQECECACQDTRGSLTSQQQYIEASKA
eukprot:1585504-Pleurochrysis_carterae.AAC.2